MCNSLASWTNWFIDDAIPVHVRGNFYVMPRPTLRDAFNHCHFNYLSLQTENPRIRWGVPNTGIIRNSLSVSSLVSGQPGESFSRKQRIYLAFCAIITGADDHDDNSLAAERNVKTTDYATTLRRCELRIALGLGHEL